MLRIVLACEEVTRAKRWKESLRPLRARITVAPSLRDVSRVCQKARPELVVLELDPSRKECVQACRDLPPQAPVLALVRQNHHDLSRVWNHAAVRAWLPDTASPEDILRHARLLAEAGRVQKDEGDVAADDHDSSDLFCEYSICRLLAEPNTSLEAVLQGISDALAKHVGPPSGRAARIWFGDRTFCAGPIERTTWHQAVHLEHDGRQVGSLELLRPPQDWDDRAKAAILEDWSVLQVVAGRLNHLVNAHFSEAAARSHQFMLKNVVDHCPVMMAYLDTDFNFIWVNAAYAKADAKDPDFFVGKNHFSLYPNDENEEIFRRVVRTGQAESYESRPFVYAEHPHTGTTWWDWTLAPICSNGAVEGLLFTLSDTTRRHLAEEALRSERANLEQAVKDRTGTLKSTVRRLENEIVARQTLELQRVERITREGVLAQITASLATVIPEELHNALHEATRRLAELVNVDIVRVTRHTSPFSFNRCVVQWPAAEAPDDDTHNSLDDFPWLTKQLIEGATVRVSRLQEVPADFPDRRLLAQRGIKALAGLPLRMGDETIGGLWLCCVNREREWPDELIKELELLCWSLGGAMLRRESEIALRESRFEIRALLESMRATPLVYVPRERRFVQLGPEETPLLGYAPEEWSQPDFWKKKVVEDDFAPMMERLEAATHSASSVELEYRMRARDGRIAWISHRICAVRVGPDRTRVCGILFDITERKKAEEMTRQLHDEIAHMSRVGIAGEFAASLAHELNQPLAAILSNAQAAQRFLNLPTPDLSEVRSAIEDIVSDDHRASETIRRLRDLFHKGKVERKLLDVNRVIRQVLSLIREQLITKCVRLDLDLSPDIPAVVADRVELQQVLLNLIINACEAMAHCPRLERKLTIRATARDGWVVIAVSDQGPPVSDETLEKLFMPFYTTKTHGLGMGLSISKALIEAHDGNLRAVRNSGPGLTISIELPHK
ncbi:MAG: Sensor histidine kinase TmoS [Planctomycetes bacterium ADurb.Bin126]|nr:MAG: Sensor histidine kinase TmoS [Planctomycetes bacterium ADurb.Bin126]HOD82281.1 PAS domain S-box protein [Phycisphaerae bacterium]HQL72906.1 PAS domain S-box protein [Phycisphaerae bacterium]